MSTSTIEATIGLAGLLAGVRLNGDVPGIAGGGPGERTCIDVGAGSVIGVHAPGGRVFELHLRTGTRDGVEDWRCLSAVHGGGARYSSRRVWTAREGGPVPDADPASALLRRVGRVWGIEYDEAGTMTAVSWQLHRGVRPEEVLGRLDAPEAWSAARRALDALHGFEVSAGSGPWSIGRRLDDRAAVRVGTTRWAWSVDDQYKGARFADWIAHHGGDRAYASALYDLLTRQGAAGTVRVGRAAEVDVEDGTVVGVSGYLVVPRRSHDSEGKQP
ncbi:MAG TPA: hypothetical protein PKE40_03985 [Arachnia sp.]|nr:hypothetical protein [Arachnia sp.]HMT85491.1 hypothetical protein [Arachnia sp.]